MYGISLLRGSSSGEQESGSVQPMLANQQCREQLPAECETLNTNIKTIEENLQGISLELDDAAERNRNVDSKLDDLEQSIETISSKLDQPLARSMPPDDPSPNLGAPQDGRGQDPSGRDNEPEPPPAPSIPSNDPSPNLGVPQDGDQQTMSYAEAVQAAKKRLREFEFNQKNYMTMKDVTIFRESPFNKDGFEKVVTELKFENPSDVYPNYQFCKIVSTFHHLGEFLQ